MAGRILYLDLDTIIIGSLDEIGGYSGPFAALSVEGMANERRPIGLNSSLMCWEAGGEAPPLEAAYDQLEKAYNVVSSETPSLSWSLKGVSYSPKNLRGEQNLKPKGVGKVI